jgi:hypothetical protein
VGGLNVVFALTRGCYLSGNTVMLFAFDCVIPCVYLFGLELEVRTEGREGWSGWDDVG